MGVAALALIPLFYLVIRASEAGGGQVTAILLRERTFALIGRSLAFAATVTAASVVTGVGLAVLVARTDLPGRRLLAALAPLPLAVPSYVAAFAWISWLPGVSGFRGAVLVLTLCCYPFVYLPVLAVLRQSEGGAEEVARTLGRGPWSALRAVTLPRVIPAASAGGLLVALYALSDFGAVSILRYDVFTRVIHTSYSASFDRTPAAVLGSCWSSSRCCWRWVSDWRGVARSLASEGAAPAHRLDFRWGAPGLLRVSRHMPCSGSRS